MNVLQRKMFAGGNEAKSDTVLNQKYKTPSTTFDEEGVEHKILPVYKGHFNQKTFDGKPSSMPPIVYDRGYDEEFDSFLDRYGIDAKEYYEIHKMSGNHMIYDPGLKPFTPFIDLLGGGMSIKLLKNLLLKNVAKKTGAYYAVPLPKTVAGPRQVVPITKAGISLTNPGRIAAATVSLPFLSGSAVVPKEEEKGFIGQSSQDALNELNAEADEKAKSETEKKNADKLKTKQEIADINKLLENLNIKEKYEKESFIEKRQERKNRNTGIFLNEMSKAMAATDNLADGMAIGAANSSDAVMQADEAEELSYAEFLKEEEEKNAPAELKESDIRAIAEIYSNAASAYGKSTALKQELGSLRNVLQTGYATGATGFTLRLVDKIQGFFGADGNIKDATAAKNLSLFLEVRLVEAVLDEKGKTISDADRKLIKDIVGNLESPLSNKASVINLLGIVETTLNKKIADAEKIIRYNKTRYGERIPELAIFDDAEGIASKEQEEEVSIADRDDVIK